MGADIHAIFQVKNEENKWITIPGIPEAFNSRNYVLFDVLQNIRHPGLPEEVKNHKYRWNEEDNSWEVDFSNGCEQWYYGFGWITLEEFQKYVDSNNPYFVSVAFFDKFIELGGKLPKGMIPDNGYGAKVKFAILDDEESETLDNLLNVKKEFEKLADLYGIKNPADIRVIYAFDC